MNIVNINNIEDLIIAKYNIENYLIETKQIEEKDTLSNFLTNTANINMIYLYKGNPIPFCFKIINNEQYLFVTNDNENEINLVVNKIKLCKYDLNNLYKLSNEEINKIENLEDSDYIIINNKIYK